MATRIDTIDQLDNLLIRTPLMSERISPLSLAFLPEMPRIFASSREMISVIDAPAIASEQSMIALEFDTQFAHRFPTVSCEHNPYTHELNQVIHTNTDLIEQHTLTQNQIAHFIVEDCFRYEADAVVMMLIDGLSYSDVIGWDEFPQTIPCFVPGLTTTQEGFQNIVGREESLSMLLYDVGYRSRFGFTYWTRKTNPLTDVLFRTIPPNSIRTVFSMGEVFEELKVIDVSQAYVQIVRTGLDPYAHASRLDDLPHNRNATRQSLHDDIYQIRSILADKGKRILFYIVSDHGILWRDEHDLETVGQVPGRSNPRYVDLSTKSWPSAGRLSTGVTRQNIGRLIEGTEDTTYFQLTYPYLSRSLHSNEWGVHGGLSFQESIVPFIRIEVNENVDNRQGC